MKRGVQATLLAASLVSGAAHAFPPYKSTDADTADPWSLEFRLGLLQIERDVNRNTYLAPMLRLNFGLPGQFEIVSELEVQPVDAKIGDAAIGAKWVPFVGKVSVGVEALALLPVSKAGGAGFEGSLVATVAAKPAMLHVNAGGFYDARSDEPEKGWLAGAIGELQAGRVRPGVELFAKGVAGEAVQVAAGAGVIVDLGAIDVRVGARFGLTPTASDFVASLWVTTKFQFAARQQ